MKRILLFKLFFLLSLVTQAQVSLFQSIPKSVNVDFSDPKGPEYRKRYNEYKDSIKTLNKLSGKTLKFAAAQLNELPVTDQKKAKVKNIHRDVKKYWKMVHEVDSAKEVEQQVQRSGLTLGRFNLAKERLQESNVKKQKVHSWLKSNQEQFNFSDSALTFKEQMQEIIASNQYGDINWQEAGVEPDEFLDDYQTYSDQWEEGDRISKDSASSESMSGITALTDEYFGSEGNYQEAKAKLAEIQSLLDQANEYTESIQSLIKGDLDQTNKLVGALEQRAMRIASMRESTKELTNAKTSAQSIREQIEDLRYKADLHSQYDEHLKGKEKKELLQQALSKGQGLVSEHFKGHEQELADAQQMMQKRKSGLFDFGNSDKVKIENENSLKGRPLGERSVFGGNLQINRMEDYSAFDISPQIGYKWNKKYLWGIGGTYRFKFNEDQRSMLKGEEVYGVRFYNEYKFGKIFAHGEYETIFHAKVDDQTDQVTRIESPGALFGLGIEYNFIRGSKGNMMVLYNFLYDKATSPYDRAFVFRFGFNFGK